MITPEGVAAGPGNYGECYKALAGVLRKKQKEGILEIGFFQCHYKSKRSPKTSFMN